MPRFRTRRVREPAEPGDGLRVLVDRLWPRGVSKERAAVDHWARDAAPSDALRKWYRHDPDKWDEFRRRYFAELDANEEAVAALRAALRGHRVVTFVFDSKEERLNNASALHQYLSTTR